LGEALLNHHEQLFELWHRVRDGTLERTQFIAKVEPIRQAVHELLTEAADYTVADGEKTPERENRADVSATLNRRACTLVIRHSRRYRTYQ